MKLTLLVFFFSLSAFAQDLKIKDYNWSLTDIATLGLKKEVLFTQMDRKFIRPGKSICSNRAHMWSNDLKSKHDIDSGKIFLFYIQPEKPTMKKVWWYHVAPVINESGTAYVMDAGFGSWIKSPLTIKDWLHKFADSTNCKEMLAHEEDLLSYIYTERAFPRTTSYGSYDCYYKITPHTFWTPETVVRNLLGKDRHGNPVRVERDEIDRDELYQACMEATSTKIGYALGTNKEKCKEYVANSY